MSLKPFTRAILGLAILAGPVAGCNDPTDELAGDDHHLER